MQINRQKLLTLRTWRAISQRQLAELAGVPIATVVWAEQGRLPQPAALRAIADVLGVHPDDLMGMNRRSGTWIFPHQITPLVRGAPSDPADVPPPR